jgi:hypothetical protein
MRPQLRPVSAEIAVRAEIEAVQVQLKVGVGNPAAKQGKEQSHGKSSKEHDFPPAGCSFAPTGVDRRHWPEFIHGTCQLHPVA